MTPQEKTALVQGLKQQHGDLIEVAVPGSPDVFVISTRCTKETYLKYKTDQRHPAQRYNANENLAKACVVYPGRAELSSIFQDNGFFARTLTNEIKLFSGASLEHQRRTELEDGDVTEALQVKWGKAMFSLTVPDDPNVSVIARRAGNDVTRQRKKDEDNEMPGETLDEKLCQACTVWPDNYQLILDRYPFFIEELAGEIMLYSGALMQANIAKKL
jgi:hypothetical protein